MASTEWVGGRLPAPLFIEEKGGFQADLIVWLDVTHDLVVGMEVVHPDDGDDRLIEVLERALARPLAGPRARPARVRVGDARLAALVTPLLGASVICVAPTPELERFVDFMGRSMPGANPRLAELRRTLHADPRLTRQLLQAAAALFRARPWTQLWDSQVLQVDVPELDASGRCVSVMGRAGQTWGLAAYRSTADYQRVADAPEPRDGDAGGPATDALSLTFSAASELPAVLRRELPELGWDLANLDVYPLWFRVLSGEGRNATQAELGVLLAITAGVTEHTRRHPDELALNPVPRRTVEHDVAVGDRVVRVRTTAPHPDVPWPHERR